MNNDFQNNVTVVLTFLQQHEYSAHSIRCYSQIYQHLDNYIRDNHLAYTPELGLSLMQEHCVEVAHAKSSPILSSAIRKLNAVYETGSVVNVVISPRKGYSSELLQPIYMTLANDFFFSVESAFTKSQLENVKRRVNLFLKYLQNQRVLDPLEISYGIVYRYHAVELSHLKNVSLIVEESTLHQFLKHLADKGQAEYGLWIYLYQLETDQFASLKDFPAESQKQLTACPKNDPVTPGQLLAAGRELIERCLAEGYCADVSESYFRTLCHFYVFLDYHSIPYSVKTADIWLNSDKVKSVFQGSSWFAARRFLLLLGRLIETGDPQFQTVQQRKISGLSELPSWCKDPLDVYCAQLSAERLGKDTIDNSVYSILRWYRFLLNAGYKSFNEITAQVIMDFNLQDIHKSVAGKNACNARIRKYISFLYRGGYITSPGIGLLLGYAAGSRKRLITVLTDEEIEAIREYISSASTPLQIRDSAILLLGTEMGMRGCDIVNLHLKDINWKEQGIRFCQDKTDVDAWLAMPTAVGNAVYRYLKEARPKTVSTYLFVSLNAPYKRLSRKACIPALRRALPKREVPGSGFHVTRKTFSTFRLRNSVPPEMIAGAMGHRRVDSLAPYLCLDDDRMKQCALSAAELGISWEVTGNE